MFLHFSVLLTYVVPILGLIAPIAIWQIKKNEMPIIEEHAKAVFNFLLSMLIYSIVCLGLAFLFIGFLIMPVLAVVGVAFPIIGGIKANNGELWRYPLMLNLIK